MLFSVVRSFDFEISMGLCVCVCAIVTLNIFRSGQHKQKSTTIYASKR